MHLFIYSLTLTLTLSFYFFFFFTDTSTTEIYTLSLHDALPIYKGADRDRHDPASSGEADGQDDCDLDRKSTRLNSSHRTISYAVFCLKKKKKKKKKKNIEK